MPLLASATLLLTNSQGRLLGGLPAFPFGEAVYVGSVFHDANAIAHPTVEKIGSTYYLFFFSGAGISGMTSSDGLSWSAPTLVIPNASGGAVVTACDFRYIGATGYMYCMYGTNSPLTRHIGVFTNAGDLLNSAHWSAVNQIVPNTDLGGTVIVDPEFMYFAGGFAGHAYWMMVGKDTGSDIVLEKYLYYSDHPASGWTKANGGSPVYTQASGYSLWPGDIVRVGSRFWWLQTLYTVATGRAIMRWLYSDDLISWTVQADAISPLEAGAYVWALEADVIQVGSELWAFVAMNVEDTGLKDDIYLVTFDLDRPVTDL